MKHTKLTQIVGLGGILAMSLLSCKDGFGSSNAPSNEQVLAVAKEIGEKTIGYHPSGFGFQTTAEGPILKVTSVKIVGTSNSGVHCDVVADVTAQWLPLIHEITKVRYGGFKTWIAGGGDSQSIDPAFLEQQRQRDSVTFQGVEMQFQKFDTGWRLVSTNAR